MAVAVALTFAHTGNLGYARDLVDNPNKQFPQNSFLQRYSLPTIRAAIALQENNPKKAKNTDEVTHWPIRHAPIMNNSIDDFRRQGGQSENAGRIPGA